jgi:hypothetical protein
MKWVRLLAATLVAVLFLGTPIVYRPVSVVFAGQAEKERKEVNVWVNTNSGVYHCPGSRWYGRTKQGKYMGECEAQRAGYRPAYHRPCGLGCG